MLCEKCQVPLPVDLGSESDDDQPIKWRPRNGKKTCHECNRRLASPPPSPPRKKVKKPVDRDDQMVRVSMLSLATISLVHEANRVLQTEAIEKDFQIKCLTLENRKLRKENSKWKQLNKFVQRGEVTTAPKFGYYLHVIPFDLEELFDVSPLDPEKIISGGKSFPECFNDRIHQIMPLSIGTSMDPNSATIFFLTAAHARSYLDKLKFSTSKLRSHVGRYRTLCVRRVNMLVLDDVFPVEEIVDE